MKIASVIARYLLGLIFLVFGLNGFLHFIPMPPPKGLAAQFGGAIFASHYWVVIFGLQVLGGSTFVESICGVGTGAAWTGNRKHFVLPLANGSRGDSAGSCRGSVVADSCGALQAISGGNFCAARGVKASLGEKAARSRQVSFNQ